MNFRSRGTNGSALPVVLAFASVGLIVVTAYLSQQVRANTRALRSPAAVQATLNARSGVYRTLENLISGYEPGMTGGISSVDRQFGMGMFDVVDTGFYGESPGTPDTNATAKKFLYENDSINTSDISISAQGIYKRIISVSTVLNATRSVEAWLGCPAPTNKDTVLILENDLPINGRFSGQVRQIAKNVDSSSSIPRSKSQNGEIDRFIREISSRNHYFSIEDTAAFGIPLLIRTHSDLAAIPDTVKSHLLLDASTSTVVWKGRRKISVSGDMQISGFFHLENLGFHVNGEIRILGNASLANVSIFSARRIFIGEDAVFQGDALTTGSINIYDKAEVKGRSSLIAVSSRNSAAGLRDPSNRYSIFFSDYAKFDGTAIALGSHGGIKTDPYTELRGVLWAQNLFCHNGSLSGVIRAEYLLNCTATHSDSIVAPLTVAENIFSGSITPLLSIDRYKMPYFMGIPQIVRWEEF